jgi:sugar lactone lactonase YvrE
MPHKYSVRHGVVPLVFLAACELAACGDSSSTPVSQITPPPPILSVFAGNPVGAAGDVNGTGSNAAFNQPDGITTDSTGNLYVADSGNNAIRKITPAGVVTTLSTTPQPVDVLHATDTYGPGLAVDGADIVYSVENKTYFGPVGPEASYITSTLVSSAGWSQGLVSCYGTMFMGASCGEAVGIAIDPRGNVYFVRDQTVNMITPAGIVTLAGTTGVYGGADGTGAAASFTYPWGVAIDKVGNLYVTDGNNTIRKVTSAGVVTTLAGTANVAGSADGTGPAAEFQRPEGIVVDSDGNAYVADSGNNTIRKITPAGVVTTVIGQPGLAGFIPGALPGGLSNPTAVALFGTTLYVTCGNAVVQVTNVP